MTTMMLLFGIVSLTTRSGVAETSDNVNAIQLHVTEDSSSTFTAKCGSCNGCLQPESNMCRDMARYPAANEGSCVQNGGLWCAMPDANESSLAFFADGGTSLPGHPALMHKDENCWDGCNKREGKCTWCGSGMCCRLGWTGGGCKGTIGSSKDHHRCVATPTAWTNGPEMGSVIALNAYGEYLYHPKELEEYMPNNYPKRWLSPAQFKGRNIEKERMFTVEDAGDGKIGLRLTYKTTSSQCKNPYYNSLYKRFGLDCKKDKGWCQDFNTSGVRCLGTELTANAKFTVVPHSKNKNFIALIGNNEWSARARTAQGVFTNRATRYCRRSPNNVFMCGDSRKQYLDQEQFFQVKKCEYVSRPKIKPENIYTEMETYNEITAAECATKCNEELYCLSFNYNAEIQQCKLDKQRVNEGYPKEAEESGGWLTFYIVCKLIS